MKITLFVIFLACSNFINAQKMPQIGIEAGATFAQSADKDNRNEYYAGFMLTGTTSQFSFVTHPTLGFLIGTSAEWKICEKINLISGLQFQNINTIYNITGSMPEVGGYWNFEERGTEKLYKLSVPVTLGYILKTGKIRPSINLGAGFSYYLNGQISQKVNYSWTNLNDNLISEELINPFKPDEEYFDSAKRFVTQMIIRLSVAVGEYLSINAGCNIGLNNSCKFTTMFRGNYSTSYSYKYTRISNSDFKVSICYNIFNPQSSDKLKSKEKE